VLRNDRRPVPNHRPTLERMGCVFIPSSVLTPQRLRRPAILNQRLHKA
jgi:hypothetical protein